VFWTLHLRSRRRAAQILNQRGEIAYALLLTNPAKAEADLIRVLDACLRHLGERQIVTLDTRWMLGKVQFHRGRYAQAEEILRVGIAAFDLSDEIHRLGHRQARSVLAEVRAELGHAEQAVEELRVVVAECTGEWGTNVPFTLWCRRALGRVLLDTGHAEEAAEDLRLVVQTEIRLTGARARQTLCARHDYGTALVKLGELDQAEREFRAVVADPGTGSCVLICWHGLAKIAAGRDQREEAIRLYEQVIAGWTGWMGADHPQSRQARDELAALRG
jgi:tetratricopeptide (TPR) repeat protein